MSPPNSWYDRIITFGFYLLFSLIPLLLTPWNYELFEFNKMIGVYTLTVIITSAWIIKMLSEKKIVIAKTPMDIPIALFVLSQLLALFFLWILTSRGLGTTHALMAVCGQFFAIPYCITHISQIKLMKKIWYEQHSSQHHLSLSMAYSRGLALIKISGCKMCKIAYSRHSANPTGLRPTWSHSSPCLWPLR